MTEVSTNDFPWVFPLLLLLLVVVIVGPRLVVATTHVLHLRRAARRNATLDRVMSEMAARDSEIIRACIADRANHFDALLDASNLESEAAA